MRAIVVPFKLNTSRKDDTVKYFVPIPQHIVAISSAFSPILCYNFFLLLISHPHSLLLAYYFSAFSILYAVCVLRQRYCNKNIRSTE